ncbi:MAG: MarR family winged helix-turn-helix transcriptional regulator [Parvularcula sp.]|jgi:DNA-binding MarR family transcriptional regulator|nr:MarR family winged helix-turn-helix transcriptional regulator [Parvularcula sp.]
MMISRGGNWLSAHAADQVSELDSESLPADPAAVLDELEDCIRKLRGAHDAMRSPPYFSIEIAELSSRLITLRRKVDKIFHFQGLSASPGWDILLELYRADSSGQQISVSGVCVVSGCAQSTALRWLKLLEDEKFVERQKDLSDSRRNWVSLTQDGKMRMQQALSLYSAALM